MAYDSARDVWTCDTCGRAGNIMSDIYHYCGFRNDGPIDDPSVNTPCHDKCYPGYGCLIDRKPFVLEPEMPKPITDPCC